MDFYDQIWMAFSVALDPVNLLAALIGCLAGTLVGVLPGLGPTTTITLLFPLIYKLNPVQSLITMAGIYYGAQYGGSTTSILVNIPGESSSVVTCLDGYQMAKKGQAGPALGISAFGSFFGGTIAVIIVMLMAPPLAEMALKFGPAENFSVMFFGITMVTYLASGSMVKSLMMGALGLSLSCIGTDMVSGRLRYTLGLVGLQDGLGIVPVAMGLFGVSEIMLNTEAKLQTTTLSTKTRLRELFPTRKDWRDSIKPMMRGSALGSFLGLFPGGGPTISSFISYATEKRFSKTPEKFGTGAIEGVAGPETANNASAGVAFIPLLCLGIPTTVAMGVLLGALMIKGVPPGPLLIRNHPELFWGVVGSMYIGNFMLLILNLPLIGLWVRILKIPFSILAPLILLFVLIGSYTSRNNVIDVLIAIVFGVVGYLMKKFGYPMAPLVLAFILGPNLEKYLGQSLISGDGSPMFFFQRPISAAFITVAVLVLLYPVFSRWVKKRPIGLPKGDENV